MDNDPDLNPLPAMVDDIFDPKDDLYNPAPLLPHPTGPQIRTALHDRSIANICNSYTQEMEMDTGTVGTSYNAKEFPEAWSANIYPRPMESANRTTLAQTTGYSPLCLQSGAANKTLDQC